MAKKSKKTTIIGIPEEEYLVEKSRPLMLMKEVPFALGELKVLDTYLARINSRDPESTTVRFSKEEYEDLMEVDRMHPERLSKYVTSIMSKVITVPDPNKRGKWKKYTLFEESSCEQDENGQWWIDLTCTTTAKKLFFNLEGIGYIRYQLKNVLPLTSKYSVFLYIYLLDNRFRSSWVIDLQELRENVLHCNSEYYLDFKYFKRDILDKALKEVNEKTDICFKYTPVKTGRKITSIQWKLIKDESSAPEISEEIPEILKDEDEQMTLDKFIEPEENYTGSYFVELARVVRYKFDQTELEVLNALLTARRPEGSTEEYCNDLKIAYSTLQERKRKKDIANDFSYIQGIIRNMKPLEKRETQSESDNELTEHQKQVIAAEKAAEKKAYRRVEPVPTYKDVSPVEEVDPEELQRKIEAATKMRIL